MIMTSTIRIKRRTESLVRVNGVDAVNFDWAFAIYTL